MSNQIPDRDRVYPLAHYNRLVFLKNIIQNPNIIVGDYTYYDDFENPENFERNVLYHFDFIGDKLIIGKFCAIASDVQFIMNGGNHDIHHFTSYPFYIFGEAWQKVTPTEINTKGDTIIGNDVWLGYNATILPGVQIGDGAVVGAKAVVTKDIAPYTIVGGNPAKPISQRFQPDVIEILLSLKWWNWPIEKITQHLEILSSNDGEKLRQLR
ncbi:MAG: CatB-related O-acetyltransferase [Jaaginema sp. PMC 1079.18]|nr:CatB-related O-acetyltransferase [Jaaginema sp. PMC 1080.18]MEC4854141.1 CatB-related O-acetyltransferase [Jaaginema sp. PMC 1079.18]MEC4867888.1 CatB-related O-acetyltransferase [Jaaginema sp. PMC 1078.18]